MAQETIGNKAFKTEVLQKLLLIYQRRQSSIQGSNFDLSKIAKCQFHLNLPQGTANLFEKMLQSPNTEEHLTAYQIAFDLVDKEQQVFTTNVIDKI